MSCKLGIDAQIHNYEVCYMNLVCFQYLPDIYTSETCLSVPLWSDILNRILLACSVASAEWSDYKSFPPLLKLPILLLISPELWLGNKSLVSRLHSVSVC